MAIRYYRSGKSPVRISAVSDKGERGGFPSAEVHIYPSYEVPNFNNVYKGDLSPEERIAKTVLNPDFRPDSEVVPSQEWRHINNPGAGEHPTELFSHVSPEIAGAYSDPKMRHVIPAMVGIAMHELGDKHDVPMADSALTSFSSALARNAVSRGLAVPHYSNPKMLSFTDYEAGEGQKQEYQAPSRAFMDRHLQATTKAPWGAQEVPQERVNEGRQWVRNRISASRSTPSQPQKQQINRGDSQFEQLKLF